MRTYKLLGLFSALLGLGTVGPASPTGWGLDSAVSFDELFPPDSPTTVVQPDPSTAPPAAAQPAPGSAAPVSAPAPASPAPAPAPVAAPAASEPFLKTGTGSVYKSAEDAVRGIEHKDALIADLRQRMIAVTGVDPLHLNVQPTPQGPVSYVQDRKAYVADLRKALESGHEEAVFDTQAKLVLDLLAPITPLVSHAAKDQAVESLSSDPAIKDVRPFLGSPEYEKVLGDNNELKEAIQLAENDYRFHAKLPGLYKLAYAYSQWQRQPALFEAAKSAGNVTPQPTNVRPTLSPATPPAPSPASSMDFGTKEGRQAIIAAFESQGKQNMLLPR